VDLKTINRAVLRFFHAKLRPCCTFDSANGFSIHSNCGNYFYWLHCKCGAGRRFPLTRTANEDNLLVDVLFSELGLGQVMGEVDRGL
jgi:hypothetical protein